MRLNLLLVFFLPVLALAGAGSPLPHDEKGRPIIYSFGKTPVIMVSDYGVMVERCEQDKDEICFYLASRNPESVHSFSRWRWDEFLEAIGQLPKGSKLKIYQKCLLPSFYEFYPVHEQFAETLATECRNRGIVLLYGNKEMPNLTCTCEKPPNKGLNPTRARDAR